MTEPMQELQFTDEEIDHAVHVLTTLDGWPNHQGAASVIRAVLRAVRAVPARCLNGGLAGHPATVGTAVQGLGVGGVVVRGVVEASYPVTTTVRTLRGEVGYLWTNTIRSWDPSTEPLNQDEKARIVFGNLLVGPPSTGKLPVGIDVASGRIVFNTELLDPALVADDDGMAVEEGR